MVERTNTNGEGNDRSKTGSRKKRPERGLSEIVLRGRKRKRHPALSLNGGTNKLPLKGKTHAGGEV